MIFPLRLFPGIGYYAAMYGCREVSFDTYARYNKADKDTHRFAIADTRGLLRLTVPVSRPSGARTWHEINVSDHGRWWETMPIALESMAAPPISNSISIGSCLCSRPSQSP